MSLMSASSGPAFPTEQLGLTPAAARHGGGWEFAASLVMMIIAWQAGASAAQSRLLPSPIHVLAVMAQEAESGPLLASLAITLARVGVSFLIAMIVGTAIGLALGRL